MDAALSERRQLRAGRAREAGEAEHRRLRQARGRRVRLHPEDAPDDLLGQLEGTLRLLPVRRGRVHPDVPDTGRDGLGMGRHHRREGHEPHRRRRADPRGVGEGAQEPQGARARARTLHGDPRATRECPVPVAHDRALHRPRRGKPVRTDLLHRERGGHDEARGEGLRRRDHDQERRRQPGPAAVADRARRASRAAGHLGREGRAQEPARTTGSGPRGRRSRSR